MEELGSLDGVRIVALYLRLPEMMRAKLPNWIIQGEKHVSDGRPKGQELFKEVGQVSLEGLAQSLGDASFYPLERDRVELNPFFGHTFRLKLDFRIIRSKERRLRAHELRSLLPCLEEPLWTLSAWRSEIEDEVGERLDVLAKKPAHPHSPEGYLRVVGKVLRLTKDPGPA
ncbi:hypothetical protein KW785_01040 [Candidatus Parcubacteria bacterium]|nr:hypothetical protein [Candidatus Parcubacteria bacterium]